MKTKYEINLYMHADYLVKNLNIKRSFAQHDNIMNETKTRCVLK